MGWTFIVPVIFFVKNGSETFSMYNVHITLKVKQLLAYMSWIFWLPVVRRPPVCKLLINSKPLHHFQPHLAESFLWVKGTQVSFFFFLNERPRSFSKGEGGSEITKIQMTTFKTFLLQNHWANFNQTPWVKKVKVSPNEGSHPGFFSSSELKELVLPR